MAENSSSNNSYLFLEDGVIIPNLPLLVLFVYNGVGVLIPLLIVGSLFYCCKKLINYRSARYLCVVFIYAFYARHNEIA